MRNILGLIVALVLTPLSLGGPAVDNEAEAHKIEGMLMAPCCGANTLAMHESGPAQMMKQEIREMLAAGMKRQQILDRIVAEHGDLILALPPSKGFNLLVYALPMLGLFLGPLIAWRLLRGRTPEPPQVEHHAMPARDPAYHDRLKRELRNYQSR